MSPFRKDGKFQIYVPGRVGFKQRSTGTGDPALARRIWRMVRELKDRQEWELLDAVYRGTIKLPDLFAEYSANRLPNLRDRLSSVVLSEYLDSWGDWVRANGGTDQTAATYRAQVATLIVPGFRQHQLEIAAISSWLTTIPHVTTGTRRKYLYALRSFIRYLVERRVLRSDPSETIRAPKKNPPRLRWERQAVDIQIVEAAPANFRALFALIKSTGAEVSAALTGTRGDIDFREGLAHIRGTKTATRDRHDVLIEDWALPYLREHCRSLVGNAKLWPELNRYHAHAAHQGTCKALGITDYTLRDARHSWAVRARKRGIALEAIAAQLGHKNVYMVATVYGQFKPTISERRGQQEAG
jgi:integrase